MDDKPTLTLVKKPAQLRSSSNFWRCCPVGNEYLPEAACPHGRPESAQSKIQDEPKCQWWINSADHQFCFWRYIRDKSDTDGTMKELVQSELAALFGWSNTKTHFMLKTAMTELTEALKLYGAAELLSGADEEFITQMMNLDPEFSDDDSK